MFKKQLVIEVEGINRETTLKAFAVVKQMLNTQDFIGLARIMVRSKGIKFDDDLSIQTFVKTFE